MKNILFLFFALFALKISAQTPPPPPPPPSVQTGSGNVQVNDESQVYSFAEEIPTFPGGEAAFFEFLKKNIKYPEIEKQAKIQGTVLIGFIVEKDGSITDVKAVKEVPGAPGLTKEAIRVISSMPKWTPGKMNGRPVRVTIYQPVKFVLDDKLPACGPSLSNSDPLIDVHPGRLPVYPGGDTAMQILAKNTVLAHKKQYADMSDKTIRISFVVNKDGKVEDVMIDLKNGATPEIAMIAAEMFCAMPQWTPGGGGLATNPKHTNVNVRMMADVYLGKYKKKKMLFAPKISILPMKIQAPPPAPVQPPRDKTVQPQFNGGDSALAEYLRTRIVYPQRVKNAGIEGTVLLSFIVSQDGRIDYVTVLEEVPGAPELTEEAIRLVKTMPLWIPGSIKGVTSQMLVKLPVKFEIKK